MKKVKFFSLLLSAFFCFVLANTASAQKQDPVTTAYEPTETDLKAAKMGCEICNKLAQGQELTEEEKKAVLVFNPESFDKGKVALCGRNATPKPCVYAEKIVNKKPLSGAEVTFLGKLAKGLGL